MGQRSRAAKAASRDLNLDGSLPRYGSHRALRIERSSQRRTRTVLRATFQPTPAELYSPRSVERVLGSELITSN